MGCLPSLRALSLQVLVVLSTAIQPSDASPAITAWWTQVGPQLLVQNLTTLAIQYSSCNSNNTPIYPIDQPNVLPTLSEFKPKNNTALSGVGWWTGKTTMASMFYQTDHGEIINGLFQCDWQSGKFVSQGEWVISGDAPSVSSNTGLASLVLGSTAGYRVYYHDDNQAVNEIGYTTETGWHYRDMVSPDHHSASSAIHAAFTGNANISVVFPRDSENIEVTRFNTDDSWHISTFPHPLSGNLTTNTNSNTSSITVNSTAATNFTLPFFGSPKGIGITVDAAFTRSVWYIGTDRNLYSAANVRFVWGLNSNVSTLFWPQADEPNAPLGVTSDFSSSQIRIYYYVKGRLTEIKFDADGSWKQAQVLPTFNATAPPPASNSSAPTAQPSSDAGLSSGAKAGIGVGVTLGVLAVAGVLGALFFFRRREERRRQAAAAAPEMESAALDPNNHPGQQQQYDAHGNPVVYDPRYGSAAPYGGSPPPGYAWDKKTPQQLEGSEVPLELEGPRAMYELPDQAYSHELVGDGRIGAELPGDEVPGSRDGNGGVHGHGGQGVTAAGTER